MVIYPPPPAPLISREHGEAPCLSHSEKHEGTFPTTLHINSCYTGKLFNAGTFAVQKQVLRIISHYTASVGLLESCESAMTRDRVATSRRVGVTISSPEGEIFDSFG